MTVSDRINLGIGVATLLGAVVGIIALWLQLKKLQQQLTLQHFSDYTKRYEEIVLHFPEDINGPGFAIKGRGDYNSVMRYMRAYFDLCYEEWYLHSQGLIETKIWDVWESGMRTAFGKAAFQQAWQIILDSHSEFGREFNGFVRERMAPKGAKG